MESLEHAFKVMYMMAFIGILSILAWLGYGAYKLVAWLF